MNPTVGGRLLLAVLVAVVSGCGDSPSGEGGGRATTPVTTPVVTIAPVDADPPAEPEPRSSSDESAASEPASPAAVGTTVPDVKTTGRPSHSVSEDDLVRFVAATEAAIEATSFSGVVFESPDIYIALAQVACARFSEGAGFDEVAAELVGGLGPEPTPDVERLAGAILGAATRTVCPEHADLV